MQSAGRAGDDLPMYADDPPDDFSDLRQPAPGRPDAGRGPAQDSRSAAPQADVDRTAGSTVEPAPRRDETTGARAQQAAGRSDADAGAREAQADAAAARIDALERALADATRKATENHEQHLRAVAEMENVRRRAHEDVSKAHKFAIESFAESLLPVKDSLELALQVDVPSIERLREGVEATLRQLSQSFERNRLTEIDPLHQKFDPHQHQAISVAPSKDVAPNHVVSVLQKGYKINDRILRPALVTVSQSG